MIKKMGMGKCIILMRPYRRVSGLGINFTTTKIMVMKRYRILMDLAIRVNVN